MRVSDISWIFLKEDSEISCYRRDILNFVKAGNNENISNNVHSQRKKGRKSSTWDKTHQYHTRKTPCLSGKEEIIFIDPFL